MGGRAPPGLVGARAAAAPHKIIARRAPLCIDYDVDELTAPRDKLKVRFSYWRRRARRRRTPRRAVGGGGAARGGGAAAGADVERGAAREIRDSCRPTGGGGGAAGATPVDLNGTARPADRRGVVRRLRTSRQFTNVAATYFADHPAQATDFYVVSRLTSFARVVVVGVAALGAGVTAIAGAGRRRSRSRWRRASRRASSTPPSASTSGSRKGYELDRMLKMMRGERPKDKGDAEPAAIIYVIIYGARRRWTTTWTS